MRCTILCEGSFRHEQWLSNTLPGDWLWAITQQCHQKHHLNVESKCMSRRQEGLRIHGSKYWNKLLFTFFLASHRDWELSLWLDWKEASQPVLSPLLENSQLNLSWNPIGQEVWNKPRIAPKRPETGPKRSNKFLTLSYILVYFPVQRLQNNLQSWLQKSKNNQLFDHSQRRSSLAV